MKELTLVDYQARVKFCAKNHLNVKVNLISTQYFYATRVDFDLSGETLLTADVNGQWFFCRLATSLIAAIN